MRENEKKNGILFDKPPQNYTERFSRPFTEHCFGDYIPPKTIQITKLSKARNYYIGIVWEEIKKRNKIQQERLKNLHAAKNHSPTKFRRGCEILQPLQNGRGLVLSSLLASRFAFCLLVL